MLVLRLAALSALAAVSACARPAPVSAAAATAPAVDVRLTQLTPEVWLHTTMEVYQGTPVPSHGLAVVGTDGIALIDTAWGGPATTELLHQIEQRFHVPVLGAVLSDFHEDRAGGLAVLHAQDIPAYSSADVLALTPNGTLAQAVLTGAPEHTTVTIAGVPIEVFAPGGGHSHVNVVAYLPSHAILFGGCLIRPGDTDSLGNTADANLLAWSSTVQRVADRYPDLRWVVPSHGDPGDRTLLDHTIEITRQP